MNRLFIHTDGGARHNPGPAAIGVVIKSEKGEILKRISKGIGETTNNVAEYRAVVEALEWVGENAAMKPFDPTQGRQCSHEKMIQFFLDSALVVNQLNGLFKVKDGELKNYLLKIRELEQQVGWNISYTLVPREKNWEADLLVNKALDG